MFLCENVLRSQVHTLPCMTGSRESSVTLTFHSVLTLFILRSLGEVPGTPFRRHAGGRKRATADDQ